MCDLQVPWEKLDGVYHVITDYPSDISLSWQEKIFNLETQAEVSYISAPGEWIVTGVRTKFGESTGNWQFGEETNTSAVTNMSRLFINCYEFTGDGVSRFDTSRVTNMSHMFHQNRKFNETCGFDVQCAKHGQSFMNAGHRR